MFCFTRFLAQIEVGLYMVVEDWRRDRNTQPLRGTRFFIGTPRDMTHGGQCNCRHAHEHCQCVHCALVNRTIAVPTIKFDWQPRTRKLSMMSLVNVFARTTRRLTPSQAAKLTRACTKKLKGECG